MIDQLIEDLSNICISYLSKDEQIYLSKEWNNHDKNVLYVMAIENGWLDLIKWIKENTLENEWDHIIYTVTGMGGNIQILKIFHQGYDRGKFFCYHTLNERYTEMLKWLDDTYCNCKKLNKLVPIKSIN